MRQRRRPPSCELGQLRPLQQIAQFVAAQAAVLHQAALARGYLSGADTNNTEHISIFNISGLWRGPSAWCHYYFCYCYVLCKPKSKPNYYAGADAVMDLTLANIRADAGCRSSLLCYHA